jgi:hypothetical protein
MPPQDTLAVLNMTQQTHTPQYATKHRSRTITTEEPFGVISVKYRTVLPDDGS